jgi:hypothetical protein
MARSNRGKLVASFRYPIRVEVRRPKFERSASLAYIDIAKLSRAARAEFEVGHFETGCCRKTVLAVVRRGVLTALRVEACEECKPVRLTPERHALLRLARRRVGGRRDVRFRPMPVAQFKSGVAETIVEGGCHEICFITIWGYDVCWFCCDFGGRSFCSIIIHPTLDGGLLQ